MSKPLELLMKKHFKFPCFGSTLKVCIVLIVLTLATSLACGGGGGGGGGSRPPDPVPEDDEQDKNATNATTGNLMDDLLTIDLKGIKDIKDRNIETSWRGWKPSNQTQKEWDEWYKKYLADNEKLGEKNPYHKKKKGEKDGEKGSDGHPDWPDFSAERGPGSGWPNLPGWAGLGPGSSGTPIPPWAYAPKNIGKPTICYLPPLIGQCQKGKKKKQLTPVTRWGYNPYVNECQQYTWSGCGGTRNKFITKEACEKHCGQLPPPSCSADSGILMKKNKHDELP